MRIIEFVIILVLLASTIELSFYAHKQKVETDGMVKLYLKTKDEREQWRKIAQACAQACLNNKHQENTK